MKNKAKMAFPQAERDEFEDFYWMKFSKIV